VFGIRPWEWDELSAEEALRLMDYIDRQQKEADGGDL
jgi:predicted DNA-binding protein (UPF0251 family)